MPDHVLVQLFRTPEVSSVPDSEWTSSLPTCQHWVPCACLHHHLHHILLHSLSPTRLLLSALSRSILIESLTSRWTETLVGAAAVLLLPMPDRSVAGVHPHLPMVVPSGTGSHLMIVRVAQPRNAGVPGPPSPRSRGAARRVHHLQRALPVPVTGL